MCERFSTGSEPVNLISAGLIVLMALHALFVWIRSWHREPVQFLLAVLALAVGAGALAYHAVASDAVAVYEDVPLILFLLACFMVILRRMYLIGRVGTVLIVALIVAIQAAFVVLVPPAQISGGAFMTLLAALYLMAGGLVIKARLGMNADKGLTGMAAARSDALHFPRLRAGYGLVVVGIIFALGLAAKALDMPLCNRFALGSHFIWHLAVALVVWRVLMITTHYPTAPEVKARLDGAR